MKELADLQAQLKLIHDADPLIPYPIFYTLLGHLPFTITAYIADSNVFLLDKQERKDMAHASQLVFDKYLMQYFPQIMKWLKEHTIELFYLITITNIMIQKYFMFKIDKGEPVRIKSKKEQKEKKEDE